VTDAPETLDGSRPVTGGDDSGWWIDLLAGMPEVAALPADRARPPRPSGERSTVIGTVPGSTDHDTLVAGILVLMARTVGGDAVLGVGSGRHDIRPIRLEIEPDRSWRSVVHRVGVQLAQSVTRPAPDMNDLARILGHASGASHAPVVQVALVDDADPGADRFDLTLWIDREHESPVVHWDFNADLFDEATVRVLAGHLATLLEDAALHPETPVGDLELIGREERELLATWGDGGPRPTAWTDRTLVSGFLATVSTYPEVTALRDSRGRTLSFAELEAASSRLARHLASVGVVPGQRVGIFMDRTCDLVVSLLAVQRAGAAYVPLDPDYPAERVAFILADAGVQAVVTRTSLRAGLGDHAGVVVDLDADHALIDSQDAADPGVDVRPDDVAYVIYTSGSTGRPKGVVVPHRGVINTLATMSVRPGLSPGEVMIGPTTPAFDLSVPDLFLPLLTGATLVLASPDVARDPLALARLFDDEGADLVQATPATWRMLVESGWTGRPGLRIVCGGEGYGPELVADLLERVEQVWNFYGPTEASVWAVCTLLDDASGPVPMGRPIAGMRCAVVDLRGHLSPVGIGGELWLAGEGLAQGYLGRPELSAERFVDDGLGDGRVWYRTGDIVRYRSDGTLVFVGRADHQVKLRGFRVELGEIESALLAQDGVSEAVVLVREDRAGDPDLVAYLVGEGIVTSQVLNGIRTSLPGYMVPSAVAVLDRLPLTPNGKLDRSALPRPADVTRPGGARGPRDHLEAEMVALCAEVLDLDGIATDEDLFDLGMTSIQAARLFTALEKRFRTRLPLSVVFEAPTPGGLAALVRTSRTAASGPEWTALVPIRSAGQRLPFFAVHGGAGTALLFEPLARRLAPDHPFYGLQAVGLFGREAPQRTVEEMAARYVSEMTAVDPHGPYAIGGYCFGGLVAWEMAHQLVEAGREVSLVAMFNAPAANYNERFDPVFDHEGPIRDDRGELVERIVATQAVDRSLRGSITRQLRESSGRSTTQRIRMVAGAGFDRLVGPSRTRLRRVWLDVVLRSGRPLPSGLREANVFQRLARVAQDAYVPPKLDVPVIVYRATGLYFEDDLGWGAYTPRVVASLEIPGHQPIPRATMAEPCVDTVAADLSERLAPAVGGPTSDPVERGESRP